MRAEIPAKGLMEALQALGLDTAAALATLLNTDEADTEEMLCLFQDMARLDRKVAPGSPLVLADEPHSSDLRLTAGQFSVLSGVFELLMHRSVADLDAMRRVIKVALDEGDTFTVISRLGLLGLAVSGGPVPIEHHARSTLSPEQSSVLQALSFLDEHLQSATPWSYITSGSVRKNLVRGGSWGALIGLVRGWRRLLLRLSLDKRP